MTKANGDHHLQSFPRHMQHAAAVGEIHSRPLPVLKTGSVILHYAFMSEGGSSVARANLTELCKLRGLAGPDKSTRYHELAWGKGTLRWEAHSEFTTFTYGGPGATRFGGEVESHLFGSGFAAPGMLISACRVEVRKLTPANRKLLDRFDRDSLCVSLLGDEKSMLATDFRQDVNGMTVYLLLDAGMPEARIGYYSKLAIELETYRTLALLGLPLARSLSRKLSKAEVELSRLASAMREADNEKNEQLLDEINTLAAELEADAAASQFRFGASRAYGAIVEDRIEIIGRRKLPDFMAIGSLINRSLRPALRTCVSVEERQANLSRKLSRTANLLRTRVEIEIENQNRGLLESMNKRARMQLRLQQTVEGLSVAAVSYYVVGLFYYLAKALKQFLPARLSPEMATGLFVPVALLAIWWTVRRIQKHHSE